MATQEGPGYSTRPLDADTWSDFARLVEANNGVWGGCWCMGFHPEGVGDTTREMNRKRKAEEDRWFSGGAFSQFGGAAIAEHLATHAQNLGRARARRAEYEKRRGV